MGLPSWNAASIVRFIRTNREAPLAILIGVTTSLVISAFIWTTELLGARLYTSSSPAWMRLVFPAAGALLSGLLLYRFFPDARLLHHRSADDFQPPQLLGSAPLDPHAYL
jgi:H+/Cl- antiporter ClcA